MGFFSTGTSEKFLFTISPPKNRFLFPLDLFCSISIKGGYFICILLFNRDQSSLIYTVFIFSTDELRSSKREMSVATRGIYLKLSVVFWILFMNYCLIIDILSQYSYLLRNREGDWSSTDGGLWLMRIQ